MFCPLGKGWVYFNSRPCERGDLLLGIDIETEDAISILSPARGATSYPWGVAGCHFISILAPARGAT